MRRVHGTTERVQCDGSMTDTSENDLFIPTERTRLRRSHKRAILERQQVYKVLDATMICHIGYVIDDQPYVTPTAYARVDDQVYWHGSSASRMLRRLEKGVPVCFNASLMDGFVMARSGFHSSFNYRSVTALGQARLVDDEAERHMALEAIVERITPGRWAELRPMTSQELKATKVLALKLEEVACKVREGGPIDDEEDYSLDIWAGVVPITQTLGDPVDDERLKPGLRPPDYLKDIRLG